uniref:Peptidase M20 dimerisation domain-containing protein n=1 Tax=Bionectria ochroleuca TaxID=29856 RepID=A0A8H7K5C7_BIOOC
MRVSLIASALACASRGICGEITSSTSSNEEAPAFREELLSLHKWLVETSSVSGLEYTISNSVHDYFLHKGWASVTTGVPPRDNTPSNEPRADVVAWPKVNGVPNPRVLLTSHIDTRSRKVDAKASVAAMVTALDELLKAGKVANGDVMLAFVVGEEVSGDGMRELNDYFHIRDVAFDAVIFGEPTEGKLACGHKGALQCDVRAHGVGGHSGYPWLGKSANELLMRALLKIVDTDLGSSKVYGNTTVNVGRLQGGVADNVIPEEAFAGLQRMRAILNEVDPEAFDFECSQGYGFVEANCEVEGFDQIVVNYGTDMPHLKGDFTKYLYGPGTIFVAHGPHENLTVGDLESAVEGYQKLILHALQPKDDDNLEL